MADDKTIPPIWKEQLKKLFVAIQTNDSDEAARLLVKVDAWLNCVAGTDEDRLRQELHETFDEDFMTYVRSNVRDELRSNSDTLTVCMIDHFCNVLRITHPVPA